MHGQLQLFLALVRPPGWLAALPGALLSWPPAGPVAVSQEPFGLLARSAETQITFARGAVRAALPGSDTAAGSMAGREGIALPPGGE